MKSIKRKGFTLVELLIVIVVIGILSAMMMMSSTEAVTSAKASNAVSNLRNLKTAALALYTDNLDTYSGAGAKIPSSKDVFRYLNSGVDIPDGANYAVVAEGKDTYGASDTGSWFLQFHITGTADEVSRIKSKLAGRAKSVGLLKEAKVPKTTTSGTGDTATTTTEGAPYDGAGDYVYLYVR